MYKDVLFGTVIYPPSEFVFFINKSNELLIDIGNLFMSVQFMNCDKDANSSEFNSAISKLLERSCKFYMIIAKTAPQNLVSITACNPHLLFLQRDEKCSTFVCKESNASSEKFVFIMYLRTNYSGENTFEILIKTFE